MRKTAMRAIVAGSLLVLSLGMQPANAVSGTEEGSIVNGVSEATALVGGPVVCSAFTKPDCAAFIFQGRACASLVAERRDWPSFSILDVEAYRGTRVSLAAASGIALFPGDPLLVNVTQYSPDCVAIIATSHTFPLDGSSKLVLPTAKYVVVVAGKYQANVTWRLRFTSS